MNEEYNYITCTCHERGGGGGAKAVGVYSLTVLSHEQSVI